MVPAFDTNGERIGKESGALSPLVVRSESSREVGVLVLAALAFSTASPLARVATGLSPVGVAAGRTAVAAVAILLARPALVAHAIGRLTKRQRWSLCGAGVLLAAHFALFLQGLHETSFPAAVALVSLEPLAVVMVAWAAFGIRPRRGEGLGVLLASAGALVVASGAGKGEHRLVGDVLVLLAVVVFGGYVAAARGLRDAIPGLPYAATVYGVASLALAPAALVLFSRAPLPPTSTWVAVLLLGLVPTLIGHTLLQLAARRVSPSLVALVSPGETVGSLAIGAAWLGAWPTAAEGAGAALVLLGATVAILAQPSRG
jgi:drug/metabolite transporter (DMT)-like permease